MAREQFQRALQLDPNHAEARKNLAILDALSLAPGQR